MAAYRDFVSRRARAEDRRRFEEDLRRDYEDYWDYLDAEDYEDAELLETFRDRENRSEASASPEFR